MIQNIPASLPHRFSISRMEHVAESLGGDVPSPVSVATGREAFVQTMSHREILAYQKRGYEVTHKLYVSLATAAMIAEDSILHTFTPTAQFPSAGLRLRAVSKGDATVNLSPSLVKVLAIEEAGDIEHQ